MFDAVLRLHRLSHGSVPASRFRRIVAALLMLAPWLFSLIGAPAVAQPATDTLRLEAFLAAVERAHPQMDAIRLEGAAASAELLEARGAFDPALVTGYEYKSEGAKDKLNVLRSGLSLPVDAVLSPRVTLDYRRGLGSSVDPSVLTAPDGEARVGLAISPFRGLTTDKRRTALATARLAPRRAEAVQAMMRNDLMLEATLAYWDWVQAQQALNIQRDLLDLATRRRDLITQRARAGEEAPVDSLEAELVAVTRRGKLVEAVRKADAARAKLSVFLWDEPRGPGATPSANWVAPSPVGEDEADGRLGAAMQRALSARPELRELAVKQEQLQLKRRLAGAQLRPDVKFEVQAVSYDPSDPVLDDVKVGVTLDQSLFFRGSRARQDDAEVEVRRIEVKRQIAERKIEAEVEAAMIAVRQAQERRAMAERRVTLAERLLAAERRRFELGESTLFILNQRESSFAEARTEVLAARIQQHRAEAQLLWATGGG